MKCIEAFPVPKVLYLNFTATNALKANCRSLEKTQHNLMVLKCVFEKKTKKASNIE